MAFLEYKTELFTGIRPTADLTIANYLGAILPIVKLQKENKSNLVFIADLHAITDNEPKLIKEYVQNTLIDYLVLGIDPEKTKIYLQSAIEKELSFFTFLLSRHISVAELLRVPTLKEKIKQKLKKNIKPENANTFLFLYPVLMAGDILINRAKKVPVGEDQLPHLEITRLIARRFNKKYGPLFPLPQTLKIKTIRILSLKGKEKMSKSLPEGAIFLNDDPKTVAQKIKSAQTAFEGQMTENLKSCILIAKSLAKTKNEIETIDQMIKNHLAGKKIMKEFKEMLTKIVQNFLAEFQEKKQKILKEKDYLSFILTEGNKIAKENALETLEATKKILYQG